MSKHKLHASIIFAAIMVFVFSMAVLAKAPARMLQLVPSVREAWMLPIQKVKRGPKGQPLKNIKSPVSQQVAPLQYVPDSNGFGTRRLRPVLSDEAR